MESLLGEHRDPLWVCDDEGRVRFANQAARQMGCGEPGLLLDCLEGFTASWEQAQRGALVGERKLLRVRRTEDGDGWVARLQPLGISQSPLRLELLGGFRVRRLSDGEVLLQGSRRLKPVELLLLVALGEGEAVSRGQVAEHLWPDDGRSQQLERLKELLRRSDWLAERLGLDRSPVLVGSRHLRLDESLVGFELADLRRLEQLIGELLWDGDAVGAGRVAALAIRRYLSGRSGGVLLEDLAATPALARWVEELERRLGWLCAALMFASQAERIGELVELLRVLLDHAPASPALAMAVMQLALRAGEPAFAQQVYARHYQPNAKDALSWREVVAAATTSRALPAA